MQGWMIRAGPCLEAVAGTGAIGGGDAVAAVAAVHGAVVLRNGQRVVARVCIIPIHSDKPAACSNMQTIQHCSTQDLMKCRGCAECTQMQASIGQREGGICGCAE